MFLTHFHADFVAGHLELRDRTGAAIYLGAAAKAEYRFTPLADGDVVEFGKVRLTALETPGHTAESISILVHDLERSATEPYAVLTGDTLFVGDVGRPDLRVALGWSATDLGGLLYESLRTKLLVLPDASLVYPAHGAGSLCGKALGQETFSTIGEQRRANYALQPMSKEAFIELVTVDQPDAPPYFTYDAVLNTKERPTLDETLAREVNPMTLDQLLALQSVGAQILDVRDPAEFASAHLIGSINIGLGGQFATWAGTVLSRDKPIVIVADPGREHEAATRLGRIGFDHVAGLSRPRHGEPAVATRVDRTRRTPERASGGRACGSWRRRRTTARPRRAHAGGARAETTGGKPGHPAQSTAAAPVGAPGRTSAARSLRRRLSVVDCRQPPAAPRLQSQRDRRRHHRVGGGQAAGGEGRRRLSVRLVEHWDRVIPCGRSTGG